ncbi:hypothetical protein ColLi_09571 [Colletotrichum liriopes]|uniref:Uncharacterized protein n=1 Tax=Colletotrichum liriopes TaxID=708192 RepID=A0AA37GT20_9PEZI|nr:hypothetical protein ColLi_09571 [Colletotrichum liriopes]
MVSIEPVFGRAVVAPLLPLDALVDRGDQLAGRPGLYHRRPQSFSDVGDADLGKLGRNPSPGLLNRLKKGVVTLATLCYNKAEDAAV